MMKEIGMQTLETSRLILRKFTLNDVGDMYNNWGTDPETCRTLTWNVHKNKDETTSVISNWIKEYDNPFTFNWVVELKETGEIIGNISTVECKVEYGVCEIGYCYGSKYWNNGYASEALSIVIDFLINTVGFSVVEARHISENPASGRVMEKAGMKKEAILKSRRVNKDTKNINDIIIYSVIKSD